MSTTETAAKKDIQKLQRAIIDGLEDVKAQDIQVFNTEHLSPLFERVIVASGTSNRQTKALAASVRDAVRDAGFVKPRTEGEENGEWIIVDCGAAVAHIMQPTFRQYYRLEDLWGEKPVRLRFGAPKPAVAAAPAPATPSRKKQAAKSAAPKKTVARTGSAKVAAKKTKAAAKVPAKAPAPKKTPARTGSTPPAAKKAKAATAVRAPAKKTAAARTRTAQIARKAPARKASTPGTAARKRAS